MQVDSIISELEKEFPGWKLGKKITDGSGGKTSVYEISRENCNFTENEVLKVVTLLEENVSLREMNEISRQNYEAKRREVQEKAEKEVNLMYKLKTCRNIVGYQDFKFLDVFGEHYITFILAIRMFTYQDLNFLAKTKGLSQLDIIRIGIDICSALEACEKNRIMHRDIKPGNIFWDDDQYLLADFGIARILKKGNLAHTSQGTPQFAAPEQFANLLGKDGYDERIDIYSLGLTLYYLANNQQLPFYDRLKNTDLAVKMRLTGKQIEPIEGINPELNRIMLKACAFSACDRYSNAGRMKYDLMTLYKKVKNQKAIKRVDQCGSKEYETELLKQEIKNYTTERAMKQPAETDFGTERALGTAEVFSTARAFRAMKTENFATERVFGAMERENFRTERALGALETESFRTERALGAVETENFSTERAFRAVKTKALEKEWNSASKNDELGRSVASIDTVDMPKKVETEESCEHIAEENVLSEQDIRQHAVSEMKKGNNEQAFQWYATLAEKEDWEVMYHDVTKLFDGEKNILKRAQDAVFWFTKCAECCKDSWTVSLAEFQLGEIYAKGLGVKKNHKIAEKYYRSSLAKGNPYAKKKFVAGKYVK